MSKEKVCPYCGEEILTVAINYKHCDSKINSPSNSAKNQLGMRPAFKIILAIIMVVFIAGIIFSLKETGTLSGHGYSANDVSYIERDIRTEFSKRDGVKVEEVKMIIESPKK